MKFNSHFMSHLLLAQKHQQLLLKNAEACPTREVHGTAHVARELYVTALALLEVHAAETLCWSPRGSSQKYFFRPSRYVARGTHYKPKSFFTHVSEGYLSQMREKKFILLENVGLHLTSYKCIRNCKNSVTGLGKTTILIYIRPLIRMSKIT